MAVYPPPLTAHALYEVNINFDALKTAPDTLTLTFPESISSTIPLKNFAARRGYFFYDEDTDPPGTPPFWPNPNLDNSKFSYSWQGANDDYDVLLTVHNGQLIGLITGNSKRWGIEQSSPIDNSYILIDVRLEGYRPNDPDPELLINAQPMENPEFSESQTYISHYKKIDLAENNVSLRGSNLTVLDMLIVWTEDARVGAGGLQGDPDDTQAIDTLIMTAVDHTNQTLSNSLINTRVTQFHTAKLTGFTVVPGDAGAYSTRENLRLFQPILNLRNSIGADIVTAMVNDNFYYCGIAYGQTKTGCDNTPQGTCGVGTAFDEYAYDIVAYDCAIFDDTFTHEFGHLVGANHVAIEFPATGFQLPSGWVADVSNNGFPEAFAKLQPNVFSSIMNINHSTPRRRFFSNPNVMVNGTPTGDLATQYNAKIIDDLSLAMSLFRTRPDLIFVDGFE